MATYTLNSSSYQGRKLRLYCTSTTNIAANTSTITWTLYSEGGTSNYYTTGPTTVIINGTQVYYSARKAYTTKAFPAAKGSTSGTLTVSHDNLGKKSVSVSLSTAIYTSTVSTVSGTWTLDTIPRYATANQSLSSKTETSITLNWSSDSTIDYIWYSTNNGSSWTGINVADGSSGSYTISGLSANTTYNIKTRVRRKDSQLTTDSATLSVATYNYPYCNSMPNFTIGNTLTLGFYNPLKRSITVNILGADNSQISNDTTTGTSISGYNGTVVVNRLYQSIPNAKSGTYKVKVTYGSQVNTANGGTYTINQSACTPTMGDISYADTNSTVTNITDNNQLIVRNQSTVQFTATNLTAINYATVRSCSVSVNGNTYNMPVSGTTATVNNIVIDSASNVSAVITMTDSRGLTFSRSLNVTMLDWILPTAIITLQRHNNFYSETDINVDADYSSIDGKNTITIQVRYKKVNDASYGSYEDLQDNVTSVLTLDNNYEWNVQVLLTDRFGGSTTYNLTLQRGMPIVYFDRLKSSTGFNCFPVDEESVEVNGVNISRSVMTRSLSTQITNLSVNTYTIIPLDLSVTAGSKLTATNDGGIQIGSNVSKILVSGNMAVEVVTTAGNRHLRIVKNSYSAANTLGWGWDNLQIGDSESITINPQLVNVAEGDVIYLYYYTGNSADKIGGNAYGGRTSLTVEVIG